MFLKFSKRFSRLFKVFVWFYLASSGYASATLFGINNTPAKNGQIALLVTDQQALNHANITAWVDGAKELGYVLIPLRDSEFLKQGAGGIRTNYSGMIVPDESHSKMSDSLVSAIQSYVNSGGKLMMVFDAGALTEGGVYAIPKSRFSSLVGLDYILYDELRERTVGLGNVLGVRSKLRALQVPPGKSVPYVIGAANLLNAASNQGFAKNAQSGPGSDSASFLPVSPTNPGGVKGYDHNLFFRPKSQQASVSASQTSKLLAPVQSAPMSLQAPAVANVSPVVNSAVGGEPLHAIAGYGYGPLTYPSFVTRGAGQGAVLLSSAQHGVVASTRQVGLGSVLFVNMPLTYIKLSDDAMPMHGFIDWFAREQLALPRFAAVPKGVGGLTFNWHLDSNLALAPMKQLDALGAWKHGPFSMHMTAGPDTIRFGDKLGFDLPRNTAAQKFLKQFDAQGHEVASHGGWIHDYYGDNANENNAEEFRKYLILNYDAIKNVIRRPMTEYSAPQGNNPTWALTWLEQNGIKSYYSLSHTGATTTKTYRGGSLINPSLWAFPVSTFGRFATFEDFEAGNLQPSEIKQWYHEMVDYSVDTQTSRLIYAHPPGAMSYPDVLMDLLNYGKGKSNKDQFKWYTMAGLSSFLDARNKVSWSSGIASNGKMRVTATSNSGLKNMAWVYPKARYQKPTGGFLANVQVLDRGDDWVVQATGGNSVAFEATPTR